MNATRYRFGLFEFNPALRELRREGNLVHLQSQPAQVLACLIENAGNVVTREQLRAAIWGNKTHVDFERGLNFCITQVRSALNDDSVTPRYIRTLARRGYQFIAPIERIGGAAISDRASALSAKNRSAIAITASVCLGLLLLSLAAAGYRLRFSQSSKHRPIVAVLRFDNETSDPSMTRFADALTDNVVERLTSTSLGRYDVIGNARILRLPRDQRDLAAIASTLHAQYVVLGQVQSGGPQTRILAHLIRLPEQTHLWVSRADRSLADPPGVASDAAQKIAAEFSPRVVTDSSGTPLPPLANR